MDPEYIVPELVEVLFRGRRPRLASIVTGAVGNVLLVAVMIAREGRPVPVPGRGFTMTWSHSFAL